MNNKGKNTEDLREPVKQTIRYPASWNDGGSALNVRLGQTGESFQKMALRVITAEIGQSTEQDARLRKELEAKLVNREERVRHLVGELIKLLTSSEEAEHHYGNAIATLLEASIRGDLKNK